MINAQDVVDHTKGRLMLFRVVEVDGEKLLKAVGRDQPARLNPGEAISDFVTGYMEQSVPEKLGLTQDLPQTV